MKRFLFVVLAGCFPSSQAQPAQSAQPDYMTAGCEQNVHTAVVTYCGNHPTPLPSGWSEQARRSYQSQKQGGCPAATLPPLEQCVADLEAIAQQQDPDAKQRREAAAPKAASTKQDAAFKKLIDNWLAVFDQMKIICRNSTVSDSHYRECERSKTDLSTIEDELRAFLKKQGFDMRDVGELGLWPSDPG